MLWYNNYEIVNTIREEQHDAMMGRNTRLMRLVRTDRDGTVAP